MTKLKLSVETGQLQCPRSRQQPSSIGKSSFPNTIDSTLCKKETKMTVDVAMRLMSHMLWISVLVATPVLSIALAVGLLISILQVITQVQEMSLSFIPKLMAVVGALIFFGPWMIKRVMAFATTLIVNIPTYF
jgi:flagellar biosynthesis protein FliQ